jgi:hypothetical protein
MPIARELPILETKLGTNQSCIWVQREVTDKKSGSGAQMYKKLKKCDVASRRFVRHRTTSSGIMQGNASATPWVWCNGRQKWEVLGLERLAHAKIGVKAARR